MIAEKKISLKYVGREAKDGQKYDTKKLVLMYFN